jgi:D-galactarolactone isomerase
LLFGVVFSRPLLNDHSRIRRAVVLQFAGGPELTAAAPHASGIGVRARALIRHAPERMVWANDRPQPQATAETLSDDAQLLDLLFTWAPDESIRWGILVDDSCAWYEFSVAGI